MHDLRQRHCPISTPTHCKKRVGSITQNFEICEGLFTLGKRMAISGSTMEVRPDADDADQVVVVDDRQMADVVPVHEMMNVFERIGRTAGD
jgi:hypothetical protein